ncbi:hypothetical protein [Streptomyces sp. OK228]|uniref:hypothetical protein n=1 Tax=Streptomyces sp. OK228 TaxID=1882786 RepID=UPI000BDAD8DA|nr:hypothetical protein [Streptomyces sp. OK228]SOE31702.1 hypothetical protein SAMN05442782_8632 [Streptomyces sp. OK228]
MAVRVEGLGVADYQEIVEALLVAADHAGGEEVAECRREIADRIGAALDTLPPTRESLDVRAAVSAR